MSGFDSERELQMARRIAVSAYTAFRYALHNLGPRGQPLPDWEQLPEEARDGWFRSVFVVTALTEDANSVPWGAIAQKAYEVYAKAVGQGACPWAALAPNQQVAWEAAARHTLALFEAEDLTDEAVEDMESRWVSWADRRSGQVAQSAK